MDATHSTPIIELQLNGHLGEPCAYDKQLLQEVNPIKLPSDRPIAVYESAEGCRRAAEATSLKLGMQVLKPCGTCCWPYSC